MKVEELEIGRYYRLKVDSEVGYNDYIYTGSTQESAIEETMYAFEYADGLGGIEWFEPLDNAGYNITSMVALDKVDFHYVLDEITKYDKEVINCTDYLTIIRKKIRKLQYEEKEAIEKQNAALKARREAYQRIKIDIDKLGEQII